MSQANNFLDGKSKSSEIDSFLGPDTPQPASAARKLGDLGLSLAKGVVAVPEAAVGLADLVSGGRAGKAVEDAGVRFKDAKDVLSSFQSDDFKGKQQQFQQADGLLDKAGVAISNPSLIANAVAESVPLMGVGGVGARGVLAAAPKLGAVGAGALGEGIAGAGSAAEGIRQETNDGLLTPKQSALAGTSGVATAAFGAAGGKAAKTLGIGDVDTMIARGATDVAQTAAQANKGVIRRGAEGFLSEGVLEELPQSLSEQILQNEALGKPWQEGLDEAAVMAVLTGGAMGAGAGVITGKQTQPVVPPPPPPNLSLDPGQLAAVQSEEMGAPNVAQTTPPDGRAALNAQQEQERQQREAQLAAQRAVASPDDEILASTGALEPVKPSAQMGINPAAGVISAVAAQAVDTGQTQQIELAQADAQDQAAYEQAMAAQEQQAAEMSTANNPITSGKIAEAKMPPADLEATVYPSPQVLEMFTGTQAEDILNGEYAPFSSPEAAQRRAKMEGKLWDVAPVFDGWVVRKKEYINVSDSNTVQPDSATSRGNDGDNAGAGVGTGVDSGYGLGADAGGIEPGRVGVSGEQAGGNADGAVSNVIDLTARLDAKVRDTAMEKAVRQELTSQLAELNQLGQQNRVTEGDLARLQEITATNDNGYNASYQLNQLLKTIRTRASGNIQTETPANVQNPAPAANDSQAEATPSEAGAPVASDAAPAAELPRAGKPAVQTTGVGPASLGSVKADMDHLFGIDAKRTKALDRIAKGTAYFGTNLKAAKFIADNGLKDTHEVVKSETGANRWDIRAKSSQNTAEAQVLPASTAINSVATTEEVNAQTPEAQQSQAQPEAGTSTGISEPATGAGVGGATEGVNSLDELRARALAIEDSLDDTAPNPAANEQLAGIRQQIKQAKAEPAKKPNKLKQAAQDLVKARADYFTPGNIVNSYGGQDEVLSYTENDNGGFSVKVHAVRKVGDNWVRQGKPQDARTHSTQPDAKELAKGPVERLGYQASGEVQYSEPRADGKPFPNAVDRGAAPVSNTQTADDEFLSQDAIDRIKKNLNDPAKTEQVMGDIQKQVDAVTPAKATELAPERETITPADDKNIGVNVDGNQLYERKDGSVYQMDGGKPRFSGFLEPVSASKSPEAQTNSAPAATEKIAVKANTVFTEDAAAAARARLKAKLNRLNTGVDPEMLMDGIILSGYHIEKGARTFVAYARAMIDDLGDGVKPYLKSWYMASKYDPRMAGMEGLDDAATMDAVNLDSLEKPAEIADTGTEETPNEPTNPSQQDPQTLDGVPAAENSGPKGGRGVGRGGSGRGTRSKPNDSGLAEPGVSGTRSGGSGSTTVRAPTARKPRGGRLGDAGTGTDGSGLPTERSPEPVDLFNQPTEPVSVGNIQASNFRITEDVRLGQGGEAEKFRDNLAAIRTLKDIEAEGRRATSEEQRTLARYVGWGGLASAFPNPETKEWKDDWKARGAELKDLLTQKEYDLARRSTLDSHYTSQTVVTAMWDAARRLGFKGGLAAETSMGIGNFIGLMPEAVAGNTRFIGVEYDSLTARMAGLLYPQSTVLHSGLQKVPLSDNAFDLNIGNPPFGDQSLRFQFKPEFNRVSIHNQFFLAGVDSLKPGGLQLNVVSRYLLDAMDKTTRTMLAKRAKLVAAIRLPDTAFKENARTSVVTDIVVLQRLTPAEEINMQAVFEAANSKAGKDFKAEAERKALAAQVPDWVEVGKMADPLGGDAMTVNSYFVQNPDMILGTLERSGKMQFKNDITVRPGAADLSELLAKAVSKLPEGIMNRTQEAIDESISRHKTMGDALKIALSGQEAGSIALNPDGVLEQVIERETPEGDYELAKRPLTADAPWSESLFQDAKGNWFMVEAKKDAEGNNLKVMKAGKDGKLEATKANVYERVVYKTEAEIPSSKRLGEKNLDRLTSLVKLRDLMIAQINLETEDAPTLRMEGNRTKLREAYQAFTAAHGFISKSTNSALVANMPDGALVQALELSYRKAITLDKAKKMGEKPRPEQADPAPILTERVIPKYEPPTAAASPADALSIVLSETGRVDIARMASLLGKTEEAVTAEMFDQSDKPLIFKDPETQQWVTRNDYLTGQVKKKLHAAQAAGLDKHIRELEAVLPEAWGAENVTVLLGATFVPPQIYADFVQHMTGKPATVSYSQATNSYAVKGQPATTEKQDEFGAEGITIAEMISDMLNSSAIKVMTKDADGNSVVDKERTDLAILKSRQIATEFTDWAFADSARRKTLVDLFNEKYNTRVNRQHDGSHLTLPGKVPDAILKMRRHQKNTIWRGISERFMLIDHVVGAGKTFTAIARAMERRRMGLSRKPAIIVPNHMVEQFKADVYRLYPGAKVLAAGKNDFEKKRRRKVFAKIASGDWDIVIIPHSSFGFIGIAPETEERYLEQELATAEQAIKDAWDESDEAPGSFRKPFNVKQAERLRDKITARMERLRGDKSKDRLLTFEQMGIDDLTVDEAHEFKNLFYSTKLTGVKGMGNPSGSQKAFDLYTKVRVLRESPTGTVTFMTGTPISNSAVEMFNMMRYLAADELKELGLEHFDAWRAQFVSTDSGWEPNETGRLKEVNRLGRSWSNMRSLMDLYYSFTDSVGNEDIKSAYAEDNPGKEFPIPKVMGGDRQSVVVKPTPEQIALLEQTIADFDSLPGIEDPYERNIERLKLMDRARKVSLDVRAAVRGHPSKEAGGKLEKISAEVKRIYDKWNDDKGTQLIFLDRSVPKSKGDDKVLKEYDALVADRNAALNAEDETALRKVSEKLEKFDSEEMEAMRVAQAGGWNAYQQIKDNLIASGIPAGEIRFIQEATNDAQKQALFDQVKAGEVRVLIGSTPRMGAGTNVQDRLVGLHHADVTWKPSDIEQREGRIIRQGNKLLEKYGIDKFEVEILAYATERTIDAKMWNLNSAKLKTINAIRNYDGSFSMDFDDDDSVSMAELAALASGNPLLLERVKLDSEINNLELLRKQHQRKTWGFKGRLEDAENAIKSAGPDSERYGKLAEQARQGVDALEKDLADRSVVVEGQTFSAYGEAAKAVTESIKQQQGGDENAKFSVKIGERRLTSQAGALEALSDALGDSAPFLATANGTTYRGRTALSRDIGKLANEAAPNMAHRDAKVLVSGKMLGFTFEATLNYGSFTGYSIDLALVDSNGRTVYAEETRRQQDGKFVTSSVTGPLGKLSESVNPSTFESNARFALQAAERAKKEIPELREKAALPFAKDGELKEKQARLAQVISELSSDKAPESALDATPDAEPAAFSRPTFSRGAQSQANESVERLATGIASHWENAPKVVVAFDMNDPVIPESVRKEDQRQRSGGATGTPEGFYYKGTVYLMSSKLGTPNDIARVLFHEALGHYGLRGTFGKALRPILRDVAMLRRAEVDAKIKQYGLKMGNTLDRFTAAEEVLAELAQSKPEIGFVQRAIAAIRTWLRQNVPGFNNLRLTDAELIRNYILPARRFVEQGGGGGPKGGLPVMSRGTNDDMTKSNDVVGNQGGRSADDTTPGAASQRKADISAEIYRLKERYAALAFNDPLKAGLKDRLNALRAEFAAIGSSKKQPPSSEALNAKYYSPDQVPALVRDWVKDNVNLLTSDATDAVRWNRIADTLDDARYPSGDLTIYRAATESDELRAGDWVTTDRRYAEMHLSKYLNGKGEILEETVDGRDVLVSPTGNNEEAIYAPRSLSGPVANESTAPNSGGAFARGKDQTQSEAFKKWFGDSKVVDADGKPRVMYHGTADRINVFKSGAYRGGTISFAFEEDIAAEYAAGAIFNQREKARKSGEAFTKEPVVEQVYLSIQKPFDGGVSEHVDSVVKILERQGVKAPAGFDWAKILKQSQDADIETAEIVSAMKEAGFDGQYVRDAGRTILNVFDPSQIKSATGNNGDFDAENPDIRFSRTLGETLTTAANNVHDVTLPAGYTVGDMLKSAPGKLNWWHKTVGTMYNLAERSPAFKRVFDGAQSFINDVSYYATEAADLAPTILPKLETWKDIAKSPLSPEDTKAISAPIFEGTLTWARDESGKPIKMVDLEAQAAALTPEQKAQRLLRNNKVSDQVLKMWQGLPIEQFESIINGKYERDMLKAGVVWKDSELKSMFNLTDKQIPLYREFRKATDKSLTNLAISDMLRFGGKDTAPISDEVLAAKSVTEASEVLRDYLLRLAEFDPERETVLIDTANKMIDKGTKAQDLIDRGYAPLSRYGQYTLDVVSAEGERVYFSMFESRMDAARARRNMEQEYPGATITQGTVSEEEYKLFAGVSPETLELFGDMLGLEAQGDSASAQAFQTYLKLAKSNRSSMKRLIQRKGIAGFNEDAGRVLAGFVYSNARQTSSNLHMGSLSDAANTVAKQQGELKDQAVRLVDYIKNPREEAQALRGLLFAQYIGGSVASAMVNMTQPLTMTFPWLSQYGGVTTAAKQMAAAVKDSNKKLTGDARLDAALKRAEEDGTVSPQEVHQLMQQSQGKGALQSGDGTKLGNAAAAANNTLSRISLGWGKLFSLAEQFNRRVTFIAAYRTAVAQGIADPDGFARKAIAETQGIYNKGNKPAWARGAVGSVLFTFKQYSIAYVEMLQRMATQGGPEGKKAALLALGVLFLMGGAGGMPGADDLDDLISGILQRLGYNFDSKQKRKEFFAGIVGEGGAQFLERGISGLPGVPLDVSGRMGMGNLLPGTGLLTKKTDYTRDVAEIAGPAGDFVKRGFNAAGKVLEGEIGGAQGAVATMAPKAAQNLFQAYDMANMGMYRDAKGMKVLDTDGGDAVLKAIGFQPNDVKKVQDASFDAQRMIGLNKLRETEIANRWAQGIFEKDTDKVKAAREELAEWNATNADSPIRINFKQILQRVQKMNQSKAERITATAPKEIRADVRRALEVQ